MCGNYLVLASLTIVAAVIGLADQASGQAANQAASSQAASGQAAEKLQVYQDLDEVTARIPNLRNKPCLKLIEANDGFFQNEVIIFKDVETGNELWSLTRELCTDLANIERRTAWSCNGQYISFIGSMAFLDYENGKLRQRLWAGNSYVADADGAKHRKLWATTPDGKVRTFEDKFNNWDAAKCNVLYYPSGDELWRITLAGGVKDSKAEPIYKFPNAQGKIVQEVSDENFMLIEEQGDKPNCYVINLNKDPGDPHFCLTYPLKGEVHPGSFRFMRSRRATRGGYEQRGLGDLTLVFDDAMELKPGDAPDPHITEGRKMNHLWYGPPDDRVGYFGDYKDETGLWLQLPGKVPVMMGNTPDGHVSWCSHDPEWFFAAVGPGGRDQQFRDTQYIRRILACNADGKTVKVLCTPFDRRRGDRGGYDAIPRPNQSPDATKCWYHSSMLNPSDRYTGSYIAVFHRPYPPTSLELAGGEQGVTLKWEFHKLSWEVKSCHVYRSDDGGKGFAELAEVPVAAASSSVPAMPKSASQWTDRSAGPGKEYLYAVTCEEWSRLESDVTSPTLPVTVAADGSPKAGAAGQGIKGWDKTPPAAVAGLAAARTDDGMIKLAWKANTDKDLRYYNVYASSEGKPQVSQKRLLVSPTHDQTSYLDWTAGQAPAVHYAITAVDRQGNESVPAFVSVK